MKSGYDQFFKQARQAVSEGQELAPRSIKPQAERKSKLSEVLSGQLEKNFAQQVHQSVLAKKKSKKKKVKINWKLAATSFIGLAMTATGVLYLDDLENIIRKVEITAMGSAYAETAGAKDDKKMADAKSADPKAATATTDEVKKDEKTAEKAPEAKTKSFTPEEINHFAKLNERKIELDQREEELNKMDAELQAQKVELDKKMVELEKMRAQISTILEDRLKADDQKVDTLVQFYSNMRPAQAAKVIESLDENLAVEVLGRMKKKNAAEIMNLLKADKAQILSEKYAGYKRK